MSQLASLDHALFGGLAAAVALYLARLGWSCRTADLPDVLRLTLVTVLAGLSVYLQVAALLLLLGPDGTQDGVASRDVRFRNLIGVAVSLGVWALAGLWWVRRCVLHSCRRLPSEIE